MRGKGGLFCSLPAAKATFSPALTQAPAHSCSRPPDQHSLPLSKGKTPAQRRPEPWQGASLPSSARLPTLGGRQRSASSPAPRQAWGLPPTRCCARGERCSCMARRSSVVWWLSASQPQPPHTSTCSNKRRGLSLRRVVLPNARDPEGYL